MLISKTSSLGVRATCRLPRSAHLPFLRKALLAAATNRWLREEVATRPFVRRSVSRFMPGERLDDAVGAALSLREARIGTILTRLGENISTTEAAEDVTRHYLDVLDRIRTEGLDAQISVKPTQLGLDIDERLCARHLERLIDSAARGDNFVWIDMESSPYVDRTITLFRRARERSSRVGIALQAYLFRTAKDLDELLPLDPAIRLVKGAYLENAEVARPRKKDVDEHFYELAVQILQRGLSRPGVQLHIATHDATLQDRLASFITQNGVPPAAYAFAMLYGIRPELQRTLAGLHPVRVLISYGSYWFPWYTRRLAERPANLFFVLRSLFG